MVRDVPLRPSSKFFANIVSPELQRAVFQVPCGIVLS